MNNIIYSSTRPRWSDSPAILEQKLQQVFNGDKRDVFTKGEMLLPTTTPTNTDTKASALQKTLYKLHSY